MKKLVITSLLLVAIVSFAIADYKAGLDQKWNWNLIGVGIGAIVIAIVVVRTPETERWHV